MNSSKAHMGSPLFTQLPATKKITSSNHVSSLNDFLVNLIDALNQHNVVVTYMFESEKMYITYLDYKFCSKKELIQFGHQFVYFKQLNFNNLTEDDYCLLGLFSILYVQLKQNK